MRTRFVLVGVGALLVSACGGGGGGTQPQTEEAAINAATQAIRGTFVNNAGAVLDFMDAECRASVDESELKQGLALAQVFLQSDDYKLSDIEVKGTAEDFDGDSATISIELIPPEGADLGLLGFSAQDIDVVYENGKWVGTDCDFEDTSEADAEAIDDELAELGFEATQDDPLPMQLAVPVGEGFTVSVSEWTPDAAAMIEELGGSAPFIDDANQIGLLSLDVAYSGSKEPADLSTLSLRMVGSDGVAIDETSCGNMENQLYFGSKEVFSGATTPAVSCFEGAPTQFTDAPLITIEAGFGNRQLFFDTGAVAESPTTVTGSSGPSPDGDLTKDRTSPNPIGTAVDIGGGWTMTVNSAELDATRTIATANDSNNPPPDGTQYALVDVTLAYDGDEASDTVFSVDIGLVGDSNIAADDQCSVFDIPDQLDQFSELFVGGSITGSACFIVDSADAGSLVAYASGEFFDEDYEFFALS